VFAVVSVIALEPAPRQAMSPAARERRTRHEKNTRIRDGDRVMLREALRPLRAGDAAKAEADWPRVRQMVVIREEIGADKEAIREVNDLAFGGPDEARLIERLRSDVLVIASLVAIEAERVVGHILFSELPVEADGAAIHAAALAPMAVRPERQRQGIGSSLVRRGLEICRARGIELVIVLGHPAYYPRFGFSARKAERLRAPFSGDAFMALELVPGVLDGLTATVRYPPAFGLGDE
jgi:putative acetyltransferase